MNRRTAVLLLCSAIAAGAVTNMLGAVQAQAASKVRRVTLLMAYRQTDPQTQKRVAVFRQTLREIGWIEGDNIRVAVRWLEGKAERAEAYAKEIIRDSPDVIVTNGTPGTAAVRKLTSSIPIVFVVVTDPAGAGFVSNLARPGGNITGFSTFEPEVGGKWLELLKTATPHIRRVGVLMDPAFRGFYGHWLAIKDLAPSLRLHAVALEGRTGEEIEAALHRFGSEANSGLIVLPTPINSVERHKIFSLAKRYHIPAIYPFSFHAKSGGLMAYGFDAVDLFRRAAPYVDRILKGERPGDLPVQAPTNYSLVVNMKTAREMGITFPPSILLQANEVVE